MTMTKPRPGPATTAGPAAEVIKAYEAGRAEAEGVNEAVVRLQEMVLALTEGQARLVEASNRAVNLLNQAVPVLNQLGRRVAALEAAVAALQARPAAERVVVKLMPAPRVRRVVHRDEDGNIEAVEEVPAGGET